MRNDNTPFVEGGSGHFLLYSAYTASAGLTPAVIAAAMRRGERERAREAARLFRALGRGIAAAGRGLVRGIARSQQRRAARLALRNLDPHLLDDLGVRREEIGAVVDGLLSHPAEESRGGHRDDAGRARVTAEVHHRLAA